MSGGPGIRDLRQWVCWRSEERDSKRTKVSYSPSTGARAHCDEPATWGTLTEARKIARERGYDGIGFVFTASDPFCGVDIDVCLDPETGEAEPWAMKGADRDAPRTPLPAAPREHTLDKRHRNIHQ